MHYKGADTNFVFYPGTAAAGDFYVFKKARWEKDEWHHIAITWGDNGMSLFIDGRKTNSEGYKGGLFLGDKKNEQNLSGIFSIGGFDAGTCTIEGVIDELRISDIVRYEEDFDPNK